MVWNEAGDIHSAPGPIYYSSPRTAVIGAHKRCQDGLWCVMIIIIMMILWATKSSGGLEWCSRNDHHVILHSRNACYKEKGEQDLWRLWPPKTADLQRFLLLRLGWDWPTVWHEEESKVWHHDHYEEDRADDRRPEGSLPNCQAVRFSERIGRIMIGSLSPLEKYEDGWS